MGIPELGVYLTLCDENRENQDSTGGPFDELTVRSARVIGERGELGRIVAARGSKGGWLGVESEPQRTFASGPAPLERSHIRVRAEGAEVFLRLFDDAPEPSAAIPELGPFGIVLIGTNDIRADGRTVAVRVSPTASWLLTDLAGAQLEGTAKTVLTLRAGSTVASATGPTPHRSNGPGSQEERLPTPTAQHSSEEPDPSPTPSVWVNRVRARPEIYISRPDASKNR